MGATKIEFRLRMLIVVVLVSLGFWAPWIERWDIGRRTTLLEWLALELSRSGVVPFAVAAPMVIVLAALLAGIGAWLRVWGTAWLSPEVMLHGQMQARGVLADGPYRYVRNPLYLGAWFMMAGMGFLMPVSGALFSLATVVLFQFRLILGEERFLRAQLGKAYLEYKRAVPRLIPRLRTELKPTGQRPHWPHAILAEINPICVFLILAGLSWSYNYRLMVRAVVVCFGLSLVIRGLVPKIREEAD